MFERIKDLPSRAINAFRRGDANAADVRGALTDIERSLFREWRDSLDRVTGAPCLDLRSNEELQAAIENLTDCYTNVRRLHMSAVPVGPQQAAEMIATQLASTKQFLSGDRIGSDVARNLAIKTLNLLFAAEQDLRQKFSLNTTMSATGGRSPVKPVMSEITASGAVMRLPAAMIFQLRQSLFPAERMVVGAGRRSGRSVAIEALFDVTGVASRGGVKADPDKLGRALIAMSQSGTYFALWIHSHPGSGPEGTHPSTIDLRQHADWLRNYSEMLVSAIMVADRHVRFWGTALQDGRIAVSVTGDGISVVSAQDHIYRLEA